MILKKKATKKGRPKLADADKLWPVTVFVKGRHFEKAKKEMEAKAAKYR